MGVAHVLGPPANIVNTMTTASERAPCERGDSTVQLVTNMMYERLVLCHMPGTCRSAPPSAGDGAHESVQATSAGERARRARSMPQAGASRSLGKGAWHMLLTSLC